MLAKTPLSKCAKPFVPSVDASPIVAWMPVFLASDVVMRVSESVPKAESGGRNRESDVAKPLRGRARTRDLPKRLPSRTPSPSSFSVCLSEVSTTDGSSFTHESSSTLSEPIDYVEDSHEMDAPPVKNTFVHFNKEQLVDCSGALLGGETRQLSRSSSAPSIVLTSPFKHFTMTEMHDRGHCNPCAYLYTKRDGCRLGAECKFCHLCPADELKNRKKQRTKESKARKAAMKAALEVEIRDSDQPFE